MLYRFRVEILKDAENFLDTVHPKIRWKILNNMDKSRHLLDPELFKKLDGEIWEFRTVYAGMAYRLFAFWDKRSGNDALVVDTHGMVKKSQKISTSDLLKAKKIRHEYFRSGN